VAFAAATLAAEVQLRVAPARRQLVAVTVAIALKRGPGFEQRAVHRAVLGRQQVPGLRLHLHLHLREERARDAVREQPLAVLREGGGVEAAVADVQVQEPLEQQVVTHPLAELPLRADGLEREQ